jgi:hypothetical protein
VKIRQTGKYQGISKLLQQMGQLFLYCIKGQPLNQREVLYKSCFENKKKYSIFTMERLFGQAGAASLFLL